MLPRERPRSAVARLMPLPAGADVVDRSLSALALALLLASWVTAYVGFVPADHPAAHRAHVVQVRP